MNAIRALVAVTVALTAFSPPDVEADDVSAGSPRESPIDAGEAMRALDASYAIRFGTASAERIRMVRQYKDQRDEVLIESARKYIDDRLHQLVRFSSPEEYRGWRVLTIEAPGRSDDHFIFMRSKGKVRRVRALPTDSFFGTDFALEDMERRSASDFEIVSAVKTHDHGEDVVRITALPRFETQFHRVEITIAVRDDAQRSIRFFKRDTTESSKEILFPRDEIASMDGLPVARHVVARNRHRGTETHAYVEKITLSPRLPNSLFAVTSLRSDRPIPGL